MKTNTTWSAETMKMINDLTPEIKGKAFDPDWFILRQRLEEVDRLFDGKVGLDDLPCDSGLIRRFVNE